MDGKKARFLVNISTGIPQHRVLATTGIFCFNLRLKDKNCEEINIFRDGKVLNVTSGTKKRTTITCRQVRGLYRVSIRVECRGYKV